MVVQCTWDVSDGKVVSEAVLWSAENSTDQSDVEDEVDAENCVLLMAPSAGSSEYLTIPACQLLLSCESDQQIQHMSVLSEARVLEFYGHHGEYLKTVRCELIEEVDDMAVFKGSVKFEKPVNLCSIKFALLRSKNEMWLYGVKVKLAKATSPSRGANILSPLNPVYGLNTSEKRDCFENLERHQEQLSAFIETMKLTSQKSANSDSNNSNPAFATANSNVYSSIANRPTLNSNIQKAMPMNEVNNKPAMASQNASIQTEERISPDALDVLKQHIDEKLKELEEKHWDKIQKRLTEMEAKIMCKLDEVESFVKPQGIK